MTRQSSNSVSRDDRLAEVIAAYFQAVEQGQHLDREAIVAAHPELAEFFADQEQFERLLSPFLGETPTPPTCFLGGSSATAGGPTGQPPSRFGDYELIEEIARGGMGVVFRARNVHLDRTVALKMILSGRLATPADVDRFRAEAENAAQLDHPNIVPLFEVGEHEGQHYFTMRLIEGGNLAGHLPRFVREPRAAAELMAIVARAVHYAHQRGILHRDLKPANILLDGSGRPHVTDFGLAKRLVGEGDLPSSTAIVGTPSYMAPEQASGKKVLSTAIDVFSFGAILYELLAGRSPFRADTPFDTLLQVMQKEPEPPGAVNPRVDRDMETICLKCLAKEPERRYGSAEALAEDLERWLAGEPIRARRITVIERLVKWARRRPSAAALAVVSVLATAALVIALAIGFLAVSAEKSLTDAALAKYKKALQSEQRALGEMRENSYDQTIALAAPEILANDIRRADQLLDACPPELRRWEWHALKRLGHADSRSLRFPVEPAAAAFSRDGRLLAAAGGNLGEPGYVTLWDAAHGRELLSFRGHDDAISGLAFDSSSRRLATAGRDRTVRIWDAATGRPLLTLRGHVLAVSCVAFSPDGQLVASAGEDRLIKLWDAASGAERRTLTGHTASIAVLAFSHDGRLLATASADRAIKVWDMGAGFEVQTLLGHTGPVHGVAFSPDGRLIASAGYDGTARVWSVETRREVAVFRGHSRFVTGVSFSPDGHHVASASLDGTIKVWETSSGELVRTFRGHAGGVWGVDFRRDGRTLASAGEDRSIKLWDVATVALGTALHAGGKPVRQVDLGADGVRLAVLRGEPSLNDRPTVEVWDTGTAQTVFSHSSNNGPRSTIALSPDGHLVAVTQTDGYDERVEILALKGRAVKWTLARPLVPVSAVTFSPDGCRLAIVGQGQGAAIWDMPGDRQIKLRDERAAGAVDATSSTTRALFDPDGRRLVLSGADADDPAAPALTVFDAATGDARLTIRGATTPLAFSHDGRRFIALDPDSGGIEGRILDPADGHDLGRLRGHTGPILAAAFSPDGVRIVTSSRDHTIKLWDATCRELMTLPDNRRDLVHLRFSSDGSRLVGADDEANLFIWEAGPAGSSDSHEPAQTTNP